MAEKQHGDFPTRERRGQTFISDEDWRDIMARGEDDRTSDSGFMKALFDSIDIPNKSDDVLLKLSTGQYRSASEALNDL